jgi:hypothetical protein
MPFGGCLGVCKFEFNFFSRFRAWNNIFFTRYNLAPTLVKRWTWSWKPKSMGYDWMKLTNKKWMFTWGATRTSHHKCTKKVHWKSAKLALSLGFSLVEGYMLTFREEKGHPFQVIAFPKPHLPQPPSKPVYNSKDKPLDQEFPENHQMCVIFANIWKQYIWDLWAYKAWRYEKWLDHQNFQLPPIC